ncbi:unnamed protein product [Durusdinium trenchii]|uniref:Uncharacterized protein n=1 Tax=Durusdinium trenchii TaxID=1381693 RepID=A0ABP0SBL8_9DINO
MMSTPYLLRILVLQNPRCSLGCSGLCSACFWAQQNGKLCQPTLAPRALGESRCKSELEDLKEQLQAALLAAQKAESSAEAAMLERRNLQIEREELRDHLAGLPPSAAPSKCCTLQ